MKKIKYVMLAITMLFFTLSNLTINAQPSGPPDPPEAHGASGDQNPGGNASLQGGLYFLLALGLVYAGRKLIHHDKRTAS